MSGIEIGKKSRCNSKQFIAKRAIRPLPSLKGCMNANSLWNFAAAMTG